MSTRRALLAPLAAVALLTAGAAPSRTLDAEALEGRAPTPIELQPGVEAAFPRESYAPGSAATLVVSGRYDELRVQVFHAGPERAHAKGYNEMRGLPVTRPAQVGTSDGHLA